MIRGPLTRRTRRLWRRLGTRGRGWVVEGVALLASVGLGVAAGRAGGHLWPADGPPRTAPLTADTSATSPPDSAPRTAALPVAAERPRPHGQHDRIPVPPWVFDPADRPAINDSPAEPAGSRNAALQGDDGPRTSDVSAPAARPRPSPVVLERTSGRSIRVHGGGSASRWALLGACDDRVRVTGRDGRGREIGPIGSWMFALAVPAAACEQASRGAPDRRAPGRDVRRRLAAATRASVVVRRLGAPRFEPGELADFLRVPREDGRSLAFGVFRKQLHTTQVSPPPPLPQLAFVARRTASGDWVILWGKFTTERTERIGLAGAYDPENDGRPGAYFGIRDTSGGTRLLVVGPDEDQRWGLRDRRVSGSGR